MYSTVHDFSIAAYYSIFSILASTGKICILLFSIGAGGGTRTRTPKTWQGILSPWCLPFHHSGCVRIVYHKFRRSRSLHRAAAGAAALVAASAGAAALVAAAYCTTTPTLKNRIAAFSAAVAPSTDFLSSFSTSTTRLRGMFSAIHTKTPP